MNGDNSISEAEYKNSLTQAGTDNQNATDNLYNYLNTKGIANLDVLSLVDSIAAFDANSDGNVDYNEKTNFYRLFSNDDSSIKSTLLHDVYLKTFKDSLKNVDTNADGKITADEYAKVLKSDYLAQQMVSKVGGNKGYLQLQDLINATKSIDKNSDGQQSLDELMNFYSDLSDGKLDKLKDFDNASQYQNLNNAYSKMISSFDKDKDNKLNIEEIKTYFKNQGLPDYIADELLNNYEKTGDGKLDIYELLNMGFDLNTERVKSYKENPAIAKLKQDYDIIIMYDLKHAITYAENNNNGTLTRAVYINYLVSQGRTEIEAQVTADSLFQIYDENNDGTLNYFELLKKELTEFEKEEKVNTIVDSTKKEAALQNFEATDTFAITQMLKNIDALGNKDGKIQKTELENYIKNNSATTKWLEQSKIFDSAIDQNKNGELDAKEILNAGLKMYNTKTTMKTGVLGLNETLAMYDKFSSNNTSLSGKKLDLSKLFDTNQYTNLLSKYSNMLKMFDNNNDGILSKTEFDVYKNTKGAEGFDSSNVFNKYDINKDGQLDILELLNIGIDIDKTVYNADGTIKETPDGIIDTTEEKNMYL